MKVILIGPEHLVFGFSSFGIQTIFAENSLELKEKMEKLKEEKDIGIIFVASEIVEGEEKFLEECQKKLLPAIVVLPPFKEKRERFDEIEEIVKKAVGFKIKI